jgi:hypothetical protein
MTRIHAFSSGLLCCLRPAGAVSVTTMSSDFESPTFAVGVVSPNPASTGQGGWGGYNSVLGNNNQLIQASIASDQAHSGTQSMRTTYDTRTMNKALDPSQGEYPFAGFFSINNATDWWVQAWVRMPSGSTGVLMTLFNALGGCPLVQISGAGVPSTNVCIGNPPPVEQPLGAGAFDQWLALEMVHTYDPLHPTVLDFRITGPGISRTIHYDFYGSPGSGNPQYLGLSGDAWWDDVRAGTGTPPPLVPLPGAVWLMVSALGAMIGSRRRSSR